MQPIPVDRAKTIPVSFNVGKQADITIFDAPNLDYLYFLCDKSRDRCLQERLKLIYTIPFHLGLLLSLQKSAWSLFLNYPSSREWNHF